VQVANEAPAHRDTARLGSLVSTHAHALVVVLTLLAGCLGLLRLDFRAVNFDESVSMSYARNSWTNLLHTVTGADPNMSLYYGLLKLWTSLFGDSVVAVRGISVLAAMLCVPVVYAIGARLFGVHAGLLAALLVSTNVFFLRYAQEARGYALVTLLTALATYVFLVELERPSRWSEVVYVASATAAFYVHFFAAWIVLIHLLTLAATRRWSRSWLVCYGVIAVLAAPMVYAALTVDGDPIGWLAKPDLGAIPATFAQLAGDGFLQLGVVVAASLLALRWAVRSARLAFGLAFTASWAVVPVLGAFAVSEMKPIFLAKYFVVSLPAVALLAAGAITILRPTALAVAAACVLVALAGPELHTWYGFRGQEDWHALTAYVQGRALPADGIVYNAGYARDSVEDYWRSSQAPLPVRVHASVHGPRSTAFSGRVWLVLTHSEPTTDSLRTALLKDHRLDSRQGFDGDIAVELYARRPG
jgi:mannosyltransferase